MPLIRVSDPSKRLTIDDLRRNPGMLVGPSDLAGVGFCKSYSGLSFACESGKLPNHIAYRGAGRGGKPATFWRQ
jgi:hypothetical protein